MNWKDLVPPIEVEGNLPDPSHLPPEYKLNDQASKEPNEQAIQNHEKDGYQITRHQIPQYQVVSEQIFSPDT